MKVKQLQEEKDKNKKAQRSGYYQTNILSRKFMKCKDALTVLAHHDLMFLQFYVVKVLCPYVSQLLQSYVPTLQCFYCKLNQDNLPAHVVSMVDDAPAGRAKSELISQLFTKGKCGWETDTTKPIFKQELTLGLAIQSSFGALKSNEYQSESLFAILQVSESYAFILRIACLHSYIVLQEKHMTRIPSAPRRPTTNLATKRALD